MDTNLIFGLFALGFGLVTLVGRFAAPTSSMFSKLEPMKERWGGGPGTALHWVGYTIIPLVAGTVFLLTSVYA